MTNTLSQSQLIGAIADMDRRYAAMLLGAGASRSSGVLLAREIVNDIVSTAYCQDQGLKPDLRTRVPVREVRAWLELQKWYRDARANGESDYSAVFRQFKPTHDHQLAYISGLLVHASPSPAYHGLAQLMRENVFPVVLTTNFDPLLENCYRGKFQNEATLRALETPEMFSRATVQQGNSLLAYLHGNLNGYDIANLDEHTRFLKSDVEAAARRMLNPFALLVLNPAKDL